MVVKIQVVSSCNTV